NEETRGGHRLALVGAEPVHRPPLALLDAVLLAADGGDRVGPLVETRASGPANRASVANLICRNRSRRAIPTSERTSIRRPAPARARRQSPRSPAAPARAR